MELDTLPGSPEPIEVDRCAKCGGTYLDFFDGDPGAISRTMEAEVGPAGEATLREPICPDCAQPMVRTRYLDSDLVLARCEGCLAVFLSPAELHELAHLRLKPEDKPEPHGWVARLRAWLKGS